VTDASLRSQAWKKAWSIYPSCYTERLMRTIIDTRKRGCLKRASRVAAFALDH
jgi:hypothetical protein